MPTLNAAVAATPAITKRTSVSKEELNYPSARWLSDKDIWPNGLPAELPYTLFGVFVTDDSQPQILDFYWKKLASLGLHPEPNYGCLEPNRCKEIYQLDADVIECSTDGKACSSTYQVNLLLVSARATQADDFNGNLLQSLYSLARRGQNLVMFSAGSYRAFQAPPTNPTTAASVPAKISLTSKP